MERLFDMDDTTYAYEGKKYIVITPEKPLDLPCDSCAHTIYSDECETMDWACGTEGYFKLVESEVEPKLIPTTETEAEVRAYNVGNSDYAKHKIQPWDIWLEYNLNPWDADIIKRVLRQKEGDSRRMDYEKIIHICKERIRQIDLGLE